MNPIAQAALNAVLNAEPREYLAQDAVRWFANVAIFMPKLPHNIEVAAPVIKAPVV